MGRRCSRGAPERSASRPSPAGAARAGHAPRCRAIRTPPHLRLVCRVGLFQARVCGFQARDFLRHGCLRHGLMLQLSFVRCFGCSQGRMFPRHCLMLFIEVRKFLLHGSMLELAFSKLFFKHSVPNSAWLASVKTLATNIKKITIHLSLRTSSHNLFTIALEALMT